MTRQPKSAAAGEINHGVYSQRVRKVPDQPCMVAMCLLLPEGISQGICPSKTGAAPAASCTRRFRQFCAASAGISRAACEVRLTCEGRFPVSTHHPATAQPYDLTEPSPSPGPDVWWTSLLQLAPSSPPVATPSMATASAAEYMSSGTPSSQRVAVPDSDTLLAALVAGAAAAVEDMVRHCGGGAWPLSHAACLFAAVKLKQLEVASRMLAAGAPPRFVVGNLPAADRVALEAAGISPTGCGHYSPLVIAVRQHNLEAAHLLLHHGAGVHAPDGQPLLLHLHSAAGGSAGGSPASCSTSAATLREQLAATASSCSSNSAACGGGGGVPAGAGAGATPCSSSSRCSDGVARAVDMESRLRLLHLLLHHGVDPLHTSLDGSRCFLTGGHKRWGGGGGSEGGVALAGGASPECNTCSGAAAAQAGGAAFGLPCVVPPHIHHSPCPRPSPFPPSAACQEPALLRLAVNWVQHQCERGRQLSGVEAQHMVEAAGGCCPGGAGGLACSSWWFGGPADLHLGKHDWRQAPLLRAVQ